MKQLALLTLVVGACHKDADSTQSAAKEVNKQTTELANTVRDKAQAAGEGIAEVAREADDVAIANRRFHDERDARVATLRALQQMSGDVPMLLSLAVQNTPLTALGHANVMEQLGVVELRLAEAGKAIDELAMVGAPDWAQKNNDVSTFIDRLEAAMKNAVQTFEDAPRATTPSS